MPATYSTPYSNFLRMQGFFMKHMWIFTTPHPIVLTVNIPAKVEPCFITKQNIGKHANLTFLNKLSKPPAVL